MHSLIIKQLDVIKLVLILITLTGCTDTKGGGVKIGRMEKEYENPETYRVKPENYSIYKIKEALKQPPKWLFENRVYGQEMVSISLEDAWEVNFSYGKYFLIFSKTFQQRQEILNKKITLQRDDYYIFTIAIDWQGRVVGWIPLKNPKVVLSNKERWLKLNPKFWENKEWSEMPLFLKIGQ